MSIKSSEEQGVSSEEQTVELMGYKQELSREFSSFSNFAISFSIISILTGINSLFVNGLVYGGPLALVWGWILVGIMSLLVGLAMAEISSSLPSSGAMYYWSAQLSTKESAPFWSWITGWMNLTGSIAGTSSVDFGLAQLLLSLSSLFNPDYQPLIWHTYCLFIIILLSHGLLNCFGNKLLRYCADISAYWQLIGVLVIIISIIAGAPEKQSLEFIFTTFHQDPLNGINSAVYTFCMGLLTAQFTFTGYDASAHIAEETKNARVAGPAGIILSIAVSYIAGLVYIIGLLMVMPSDINLVIQGGLIVIFTNSVGQKFAIFLSLIVAVAMYFCGLSALTCNSRTVFAFCRDGALPYSKVWQKVEPKSKTPINAVWLSCGAAAFLALPSLLTLNDLLSNGTPIAFTAVTSISVIGLYVSYVIPVFLRHTSGKETFRPGPFHLGRYSFVIGWICILWVAFICILFVLPHAYPATLFNFNYTGPMIFLCALLFMGWFFLSARFWFVGPKRILSQDVEKFKNISAKT